MFCGVESRLAPTPDVVVGPGARCLASGWLSVLGPRRIPDCRQGQGRRGGPLPARSPADGQLGRPPLRPRAWESRRPPPGQERPARRLLDWTPWASGGAGRTFSSGPAGREGGGRAGGPCALAGGKGLLSLRGVGCVRPTLARPGGLLGLSLGQAASLGSSHPPPSQPGSPVGSLEPPSPLQGTQQAPAEGAGSRAAGRGWERNKTKQNNPEIHRGPTRPTPGLLICLPACRNRAGCRVG